MSKRKWGRVRSERQGAGAGQEAGEGVGAWGVGAKVYQMESQAFLVRAWLLSASRDQTGLSWLFEVPRVRARVLGGPPQYQDMPLLTSWAQTLPLPP